MDKQAKKPEDEKKKKLLELFMILSPDKQAKLLSIAKEVTNV